MNTPGTCPFCRSRQVLEGKVIGREGYGFKPDGISGFAFTVRINFGFDFGPEAHYCAACGMVWSKANAKDAAKFLDEFATDELKTQLAAPRARAK